MFSGKVFPPIECKYSVPRFTWTTALYKSENPPQLKLLEVVLQNTQWINFSIALFEASFDIAQEVYNYKPI